MQLFLKNIYSLTSPKKNFYKDFFSKHDQVEKWYDIYQKDDIASYIVQQRLKQTIDWIFECRSQKKNKRVLDIGCGTGITSHSLAKLNYRIVGADHSLPMVQRAKIDCTSKEYQIDFLQADIEKLPFKTNSFDFVICLGVISYLESADFAISEIARIIKPSGIAILSFLGRRLLIEYLLMFYRNVKYLLPFKSSKKNYLNLQRYKLDSIYRLITQSRLKITEIKVVDYSYLTLYWRRLISTRFAMNMNRYLFGLSHKWPFNRLGDMYLVKSEKRIE